MDYYGGWWWWIGERVPEPVSVDFDVGALVDQIHAMYEEDAVQKFPMFHSMEMGTPSADPPCSIREEKQVASEPLVQQIGKVKIFFESREGEVMASTVVDLPPSPVPEDGLRLSINAQDRDVDTELSLFTFRKRIGHRLDLSVLAEHVEFKVMDKFRRQ